LVMPFAGKSRPPGMNEPSAARRVIPTRESFGLTRSN
jgi:hypothetical protein